MKYEIKGGMFSQTVNFEVVFVSGCKMKNMIRQCHKFSLYMYSLNCSKAGKQKYYKYVRKGG